MKVWKYHYCKCNCGRRIPVKNRHKYHGIPKYINGHQQTKNSPFKKGNKYGLKYRFKKGKKCPHWVDGFGSLRNAHRIMSEKRGFDFIEINSPSKTF